MTIVSPSSTAEKILSPRTDIADSVRMAYQLVRWAKAEPSKRFRTCYSRIGPWTEQFMVLGFVYQYYVSLERTHCLFSSKVGPEGRDLLAM